jgi:UDP-4-amino-4,6-dideoxy-N-acetyl-beta-L-altrosamine N-acetyltransferase
MTVRLRQVEHEDSERLLAWRNSPEVAAYMYTDHRISQAEHDRWFAAALTLDDRRYWIIEMDGEPVGLANLARIDPIIRRCDWAYYLGEASTRGRGVGAQVEYIVSWSAFRTWRRWRCDSRPLRWPPCMASGRTQRSRSSPVAWRRGAQPRRRCARVGASGSRSGRCGMRAGPRPWRR